MRCLSRWGGGGQGLIRVGIERIRGNLSSDGARCFKTCSCNIRERNSLFLRA